MLPALLVLALLVCLALYIRQNDRKLARIPAVAAAFNPHRITTQDVEDMSQQMAQSPEITIREHLPPKTGRKYIVVGGGGFLGGWIISHLLERGESADYIRILDIRPPTRPELSKVPFIPVDMTDSHAVSEAFNAPWPVTVSRAAELTVFHTAANVRYYERAIAFLERSSGVNVVGTQNVVDAAREVGATALIFTSSGSVAVKNTRFWLWPWESEPHMFVQTVDDSTLCEKPHSSFFSNYAVSKWKAEQIVIRADRSTTAQNTVLRTGSVRPGNAVFGSHGDLLVECYLIRKSTPSWIYTILSSFIYVENCSQAHLCYEQRLIELSKGSTNPDIGGQVFNVTDSGPPVAYGDLYKTVTHLTAGRITFPRVSCTLMLGMASLVEAYTLVHRSVFSRILPPMTGDLLLLQPAMFALTSVHLIFDDSRARLSAEKGGLGYTGPWTTMQAVHKTVNDWHTSQIKIKNLE